MICPVCRDEYRPGFTRCATCNVDLVDSLDAAKPATAPAPVGARERTGVLTVEMTVPYCGFLSLDEARSARDALRARAVHALIVITESAGAEEYWLRVAPADLKATTAVLGPPDEVASGEETFTCSACGATVGSADRACPGCGLEFSE